MLARIICALFAVIGFLKTAKYAFRVWDHITEPQGVMVVLGVVLTAVCIAGALLFPISPASTKTLADCEWTGN
ncbi:hypothetical protein KW785_01290 [Candidatus Parcubacteria bacterium]|nr:hypothetical protein [Candidatus Parcubacteria bacterium]